MMKGGMSTRFVLVFALGTLLFFPGMAPSLAAQDDFGFGFSDEETERDSGSGGALSGGPFGTVSIGGEVSASLTGFVSDFSDAAKVHLGDLLEAGINFSASGSNADAVINLKFTPVFDGSSFPLSIDEAYLRAYFGSFDIEGGLRKLTWGKADALGPLDVINPLDFSDYTRMNDVADMKIARPLIHASFRLGSFTKLEGVFVPVFRGHNFATEGRWKDAQMDELQNYPSVSMNYADTQSMRYAQAGLRFTTSIGKTDVGAQYFYGNLFQPAYTINLIWDPFSADVRLDYNRYHQIGIDYARVAAGFNIRAEAAANITEDLEGDDGAVYNPSLAWSLGFDRDLLWGINLNVEGLGSLRLLDDKVGDFPFDTEGDADMTATRIIISLTKSFLRDTLELRASGIWEIEEKDCILMPSITWTRGDVALVLSAGIFAGDKEGQFGQYHGNSFLKAGISYTF
jgi:hypothetical protein